ncbi:hypothetical protein J2805_003356 [Arthrobacter oryzae]|nr:hypothetical protein [Arthrobacter oryzae]
MMESAGVTVEAPKHGEVHKGAHVLAGLDEVDGGDQGKAGGLCQVLAGRLGVTGGGVQAGGAEVDFVDDQFRLGQAQPVLADGDGVGAELLAQRHGDGVLQLGRPLFTTVRSSSALAVNASSSSVSASSSSRPAKMVPSFTAVG